MSPRLPQNAADRARRAPERGPRSAGVWPIRRSRQNDIASRLQRESRRQQNPTPPDSLVRGRALSEARLSGANLHGANFCGADLRNATLMYANLSEADLSGARLSRANLREANLSKA